MGEAATVYAKELHRLRYGHPLWWPEHTMGPGGRERAIEIGDVGYIDSAGAFHPLFNITEQTKHEFNANRSPPNYTPFPLGSESIERKHSFLQRGPLQSASVRGYKIQPEITIKEPTSTAAVALSYRFECKKDQGAILMLWDDATQTELQRQEKQFREYMKANHETWYAFVKDDLQIDRTREDIVLVRGFVKTSAWTVAAFLGENSHSHEVTLNEQLGTLTNAGIVYESHEAVNSSIPQRSGPATRVNFASTPELPSSNSSEPTHDTIHTSPSPSPLQDPPPRDQCVFLNYYKIKYHSRFLKKIIAAADAANPGPKGNHEGHEGLLTELSLSDDPEEEFDIQPESVIIKPLDPLDIILDYVLECSHARVAIASYSDLENFQLDDQWPSTFSGVLRTSLPEISVDHSVGTLSSSPARVFPILPLEILGIVIRCLTDDIVTLKSCCLVCCAWYRLCGPHVFGFLQPLRGGQDPEHCLQAFNSSMITTDSTPVFCKWVHTLRLAGIKEGSSQTLVPAPVLVSILEKLPNIRVLELEEVDISGYLSGVGDFDTLPLRQTKLDILSLTHVRLGERLQVQLLLLLRMFSSLGTLRVCNSDILDNNSAPRKPALILPDHFELKGLTLEAYPSTKEGNRTLSTYQMLNALLESHPLCSLRSIQICCHTVEDAQAVGRLCRKAHETLQDVELDISNITGASDDYQHIANLLSLHMCDNLDNLCINTFRELNGSSLPRQWKRASELLVEVISGTSPAVKSMTIPLPSHHVGFEERDTICWDAVRRLERGSGWQRFGNLTELIFALTPNCKCSILDEHYISLQLPDLVNNDLLKFSRRSKCFFTQQEEDLHTQYVTEPRTSQGVQLIKIPQTLYTTRSQFCPEASVVFSTRGTLGVNLRDAFDGNLSSLDYRDCQHHIATRRITLRILWPGYDEWACSNIIISSLGNPSVSCTMHKLVNAVAHSIQNFYIDMSVFSGGDRGWELQNIDFNALYITELLHVSPRGWQPVLSYEVPQQAIA